MKVRILRFERSQGPSGKEEIFMQVEANNGTGLFTRSEWITEDEVAQINQDEQYKQIVAHEIAERAVLAAGQS